MGGRFRQRLHKEGQKTGEQATGLFGLQCVCSCLLQGKDGLDKLVIEPSFLVKGFSPHRQSP